MDQVALFALLPFHYQVIWFNELYTLTRYFLKKVASYRPVRSICEKRKQSRQFIDSALYNPVRLKVRVIRFTLAPST